MVSNIAIGHGMTEDPFENHDPYKKSTIDSLLLEYNDEDLQKSGEVHILLKRKLEALTLEVWDLAMEKARNRDAKTVEEQDLIDAFDELLYPYTLLEEAAVTMGDYESEFRRVAEEARLADLSKEEGDDE